MEFAFGSSAPRMTDQRDSSHWGSRSIFERRSVERDVDLKNKRTASAQALDRNNEDSKWIRNSRAARIGEPLIKPRSKSKSQPVSPSRESLPPWNWVVRDIDIGDTKSDCGGIRLYNKSTEDLRFWPPSFRAAIPRTRSRHDCSFERGTSFIRGDETGNSFTAAQMGAHRRRTDLIPTILMGRDRGSTPSTPGLSRENSTASRPSSAMSGGGRGQVRLRSAPTRRPRPLSIATTGMTSSTNGMTTSMFEDRQRPQLRNKASATPKMDRMKRAKSVTSEHGIEDDQRSNSSSTASGPINSASTPVRPSSARKTPAQVKAEAAARRSKVIGRAGPPKTGKGSNSVSPALSSDQLHGGGGEGLEEGKRQITPDIIKDNGKKNSYGSISMEGGEEKHDKEGKEEAENEKDEDEKEKEDKPEKKIISSEEEAKAKLAEKRREMKEKKEREAEVERLRLEEEERIEQERLRIEEEEERRMVEETERIASEARRAEEERIQRAIEETEAEEKRVKEEAERSRKEKEESEKRKKEEEEKREADLQEKLKKEEEERQARKKRIEEIMARTRAAKETPTSTPKKEEVESDKPADIPSQPSQPQSLDTNVDPTTPDILGDLSSSVQTENERNLIQNGDEHKDDHSSQNGDHSSQNGGDSASNGDLIKCDSNGELEKGALDSLSNKSEDSQASNKQSSLQSSLIELENGSSKMSALEIEFDEILDLGSEDNKTSSQQPPQPPILAFEPSSQSTDLMS
ncbi:ensconsin isoform X2 [Eurytemora carolleeae]|uniref:ensconsin isoform X2 n=1 Tax=Eurytemora carolleeae TaxID=1294199 RepID=UPI000C7888BC|nr:ensconsin isoform X2 [Eurytemora carolleeae]|eukprot:XP_023325040.1 ensconsin-like isoform X2 [Eurytemora affinis]